MSDFRETVDKINSDRRNKMIKFILIFVIIVLIVVFRHQIDTSFNIAIDSVKEKLETVFEEKEPEKPVDYIEESIDDTTEKVKEPEIIYIVTASYINIRENAGVDYPSITTAAKGDELIGTGNKKEAENGRPWYEVYLTEEKTDTGWVSSKVSEPKEQKRQ